MQGALKTGSCSPALPGMLKAQPSRRVRSSLSPLLHLLCQQDDLEATKCCCSREKSCSATMGFRGFVFSPLFLQPHAAHLSVPCKSSACSCYHPQAAAEGILLCSFGCSGPNYKLYCMKGNVLGDSRACCQASGPRLFSASSKCRSGAWPWCNGHRHSAFDSPQLLKPFFPLCPEKAEPRRCPFTGP